MNLIDWSRAVADTVKDYVSRSVTQLSARMAALEQQIQSIPSGRDGMDGKSVTIEEVAPLLTKAVADAVALIPVPQNGADGKSVTVEDVQPLIEQVVSRAVSAIPEPQDGARGEPGPAGKDGRNAFEVAVSLGYERSVHDWMQSLGGPPGERGEKGEPGESIKGDKGDPGESIKGDPGADGKSVTLDDVRPLIEEAVKAIPAPKDGRDGIDGKDGSSVTLDQVMPELRAELQRAISAIPLPKDGAPGKDGESVTIEDLMPLFEAALAKAVLDVERRGMDMIQRCIDRIEKPKDGKNGRDALDLENFEMSLAEDGRTLTLMLIRGEERVEKSIRLPHTIYRGIYKAGERYQRGDSVTFGGSQFIAMSDTDAKPETDSSWKLAVKRGRDGAPGVPGVRGPEGPRGKDGWATAAR